VSLAASSIWQGQRTGGYLGTQLRCLVGSSCSSKYPRLLGEAEYVSATLHWSGWSTTGSLAATSGSPGESMASRSSFLGPLLVSLGRTWWVQRHFVSTPAYLYDPRQTEDSVESNFGPTPSLLGRLNQGFLLSFTDRLRTLWTSSSSITDDCSGVTTTAPWSANSLAGTEGISGNVLLVASMHDEVVRPAESAFFSRAVGVQDDDGNFSTGVLLATPPCWNKTMRESSSNLLN
jgi:hypothetical protein